ncbi:hypothetical protein BH09ACT4_BH09ACT4_06470 [soil metagenome]
MSIRLTDQGALIAVCENLEIDGIQVAAVAKGSMESTELWRVGGDEILVPSGRTFEYGAEVLGMEEVAPPSTFEVEGRFINVHLLADSGETVYGAHFDGDKMSADRWLGSDNQLRDDPC